MLPKNYRSAFFENDVDREDYGRKLRDALQVQLQKEKNISFDEIKSQYLQWGQELQAKYHKRSTQKKTIVFDLDETLVRAQRDEFENGYDSRITVIDPTINTADGTPGVNR